MIPFSSQSCSLRRHVSQITNVGNADYSENYHENYTKFVLISRILLALRKTGREMIRLLSLDESKVSQITVGNYIRWKHSIKNQFFMTEQFDNSVPERLPIYDGKIRP